MGSPAVFPFPKHTMSSSAARLQVVLPHEKHVEMAERVARILVSSGKDPHPLELPLFRHILRRSARTMWVSTAVLRSETFLEAATISTVLHKLSRRGLARVSKHGETMYAGVPAARVVRTFLERVGAMRDRMRDIAEVEYANFTIRCVSPTCNHEYWVHDMARLYCEVSQSPRCDSGHKLVVCWNKDMAWCVPPTPAEDVFGGAGVNRCGEVRLRARAVAEECDRLLESMAFDVRTHLDNLQDPTWEELAVFLASGAKVDFVPCRDDREWHLQANVDVQVVGGSRRDSSATGGGLAEAARKAVSFQCGGGAPDGKQAAVISSCDSDDEWEDAFLSSE